MRIELLTTCQKHTLPAVALTYRQMKPRGQYILDLVPLMQRDEKTKLIYVSFDPTSEENWTSYYQELLKLGKKHGIDAIVETNTAIYLLYGATETEIQDFLVKETSLRLKNEDEEQARESALQQCRYTRAGKHPVDLITHW